MSYKDLLKYKKTIESINATCFVVIMSKRTYNGLCFYYKYPEIDEFGDVKLFYKDKQLIWVDIATESDKKGKMLYTDNSIKIKEVR